MGTKIKQRREVVLNTNTVVRKKIGTNQSAISLIYFQYFLLCSRGNNAATCLCDPDLFLWCLHPIYFCQLCSHTYILPDCPSFFLSLITHSRRWGSEFVLLIQKRGTFTRRASLWWELYFKSSLQVSVVQIRKCKWLLVRLNLNLN